VISCDTSREPAAPRAPDGRESPSTSDAALNAKKPVPFSSGELLTSGSHGPVPLSPAAERKLAGLVSDSIRCPQADYDEMLTLEMAPTLSIRSKDRPEINFGWHGKYFLGEQALYRNEKAEVLWHQLVRIVLSGKDDGQKLSEIGSTIDRF
jgi:hypothetical protein